MSAPTTLCMPSMAFFPSLGSLEWPVRPSTRRRSISTPLCARTGRMSVGSPMMAWRARGLPCATSARAPSMLLSSSAVATTISGAFRLLGSSPSTASTVSARKAFMSDAPRPYSLPSLLVALNGSVRQRAASKGTVSV
jgi:hypothetical protein